MRPCVVVGVVVAALGMGVAGEAGAHVGSHEVVMRNLAFEPARLDVDPGETVTWLNGDDTAHRVSFGSPVLNGGESWSKTFPSAGWFEYWCDLHPAMTGAVSVGGVGPPPPPPPPPVPEIDVPADAGLAEAVAAAGPGTVIRVAPGSYTVTRPLVVSAPGVVLQGAGSAEVVVSASGAVPVGVDVQASGVRVSGFTLRHFGDAAVRVGPVSGFDVADVRTRGRHRVGVLVQGAGGGVVRAVDAGAPSDAGVVVADCESCGTRVVDAVVSGGRHGVRIGPAAAGVVVERPVARDASVTGLWIDQSQGVDVMGATLAAAGYGVAVTGPAVDVRVGLASAAGGWAGIGWDGVGLRVSFTAPDGTTADPPVVAAARLRLT